MQDQTDKALSEQQHKLLNSESKIGFYESKVNESEKLLQEIIELKGEISALKSTNMIVEREKDKMLVRKLFNTIENKY